MISNDNITDRHFYICLSFSRIHKVSGKVDARLSEKWNSSDFGEKCYSKKRAIPDVHEVTDIQSQTAAKIVGRKVYYISTVKFTRRFKLISSCKVNLGFAVSESYECGRHSVLALEIVLVGRS
jgi:hypothetical protein